MKKQNVLLLAVATALLATFSACNNANKNRPENNSNNPDRVDGQSTNLQSERRDSLDSTRRTASQDSLNDRTAGNSAGNNRGMKDTTYHR
jgi:hypothetical protein